MDVTEFWQLMDKTREASGNDGWKQAELLVEELVKLSEEEILAYQDIFNELHNRAYNCSLWNVAELIGTGCSDDDFSDFRAWLIGQGKVIYEFALENPDTLADFVEVGADTQVEFLNYVATNAFKRKTGSYEMPMTPMTFVPQGLTGIFYHEPSERQKHYPKVWAKFSNYDRWKDIGNQ